MDGIGSDGGRGRRATEFGGQGGVDRWWNGYGLLERRSKAGARVGCGTKARGQAERGVPMAGVAQACAVDRPAPKTQVTLLQVERGESSPELRDVSRPDENTGVGTIEVEFPGV